MGHGAVGSGEIRRDGHHISLIEVQRRASRTEGDRRGIANESCGSVGSEDTDIEGSDRTVGGGDRDAIGGLQKGSVIQSERTAGDSRHTSTSDVHVGCIPHGVGPGNAHRVVGAALGADVGLAGGDEGTAVADGQGVARGVVADEVAETGEPVSAQGGGSSGDEHRVASGGVAAGESDEEIAAGDCSPVGDGEPVAGASGQGVGADGQGVGKREGTTAHDEGVA